MCGKVARKKLYYFTGVWRGFLLNMSEFGDENDKMAIETSSSSSACYQLMPSATSSSVDISLVSKSDPEFPGPQKITLSPKSATIINNGIQLCKLIHQDILVF